MTSAEDVTDTTFQDEVIALPGLTLIDFWAPGCGPCRVLGPVIDELADEYQGRARVLKLDVDENPLTAARYGIRSIPSVLFFKDGTVVETVVGVIPRAQLAAKIEGHLQPNGKGRLNRSVARLKQLVAEVFRARQPRAPTSGSGCC